MNKTAGNKSRNQAPTRSEQRVLHLAAVVRRNVYAFVIQEAMNRSAGAIARAGW